MCVPSSPRVARTNLRCQWATSGIQGLRAVPRGSTQLPLRFGRGTQPPRTPATRHKTAGSLSRCRDVARALNNKGARLHFGPLLLEH
ncbi:hypothetical protein NDU88_001116 [Pleurodeles waltl]|uniref:Uncharacterized protein n=1 Tax=Pleurodeles waltl TaxID=8319 RepID=A0AAV7V6W8_PLEWA|nr:hypothetical protein NDU88_001116 [Pleurodeles waltl]